MIEYDKIDISVGIDIKKTDVSKECKIFHYWYFKVIGFNYKPYLCNGYNDLMQRVASFKHLAIAYVKEVLTELTFAI